MPVPGLVVPCPTDIYGEAVLSRTIDEVGGDALIGVHGDGY